jgi:hypothetical protein
MIWCYSMKLNNSGRAARDITSATAETRKRGAGDTRDVIVIQNNCLLAV